MTAPWQLEAINSTSSRLLNYNVEKILRIGAVHLTRPLSLFIPVFISVPSHHPLFNILRVIVASRNRGSFLFCVAHEFWNRPNRVFSNENQASRPKLHLTPNKPRSYFPLCEPYGFCYPLCVMVLKAKVSALCKRDFVSTTWDVTFLIILRIGTPYKFSSQTIRVFFLQEFAQSWAHAETYIFYTLVIAVCAKRLLVVWVFDEGWCTAIFGRIRMWEGVDEFDGRFVLMVKMARYVAKGKSYHITEFYHLMY